MASKAQRVGRTLRSHGPAPGTRAGARSAPTRIDVPAYQGFWSDPSDLAGRPAVARASQSGVVAPIAEKFSLVTACRACRDTRRARARRHIRHFSYSSHVGPTYTAKSCRTACLRSVRRSGLIRRFTPRGRQLADDVTDRADQAAPCDSPGEPRDRAGGHGGPDFLPADPGRGPVCRTTAGAGSPGPRTTA
jgi:hypothetical protein